MLRIVEVDLPMRTEASKGLEKLSLGLPILNGRMVEHYA